MNILFTCAGRRNYLINYFKKALGNNGNIIAADMQLSAPALAVADKSYKVSDVYAPNYIFTLLEICKTEKIDALISLNDLELPILATEIIRFEEIGVKLLLSTFEVINLCFDKKKSNEFANKLNIKAPKTYYELEETFEALNDGNISFPLVVKPRWGSASIGIEYPKNFAELKLVYQLLEIKIKHSILAEASKLDSKHAILIQEKIHGKEYGLDILNDLNGHTHQVYVKEKLAMRAGETDKAVLRSHLQLENLGYLIGNALKHIGNLDCDVFEQNGDYYLLEMNPRFGGGYPFTQMSGGNYPAAIIAWLYGKEYDFSSFKRNYDQVFSKCDTLIPVKSD